MLTIDPPIATISLNDPARRNALGSMMFDQLEAALAAVARDERVHIVLLRGEGTVFCAGFDLGAAAQKPELVGEFILRLSGIVRTLRRLPHVVVAAVQGAAIAGGCALLSGCDFVFASHDAAFGYPVHRLGVSPALTIPTLQQMLGEGQARVLLMSGELINAHEAHRLGLVTHVSESAHTVASDALQHCRTIANKGPHALRTTKAWLNELDGSLADERFYAPAADSALLATQNEALVRLASWRTR